MKQLFALLLIISISVLSWSTCAENTLVEVDSLRVESSKSSNSILLKPFSSVLALEENNNIESHSKKYKNNDFFEMTMMFNDKLQQLIASLKRTNSKVKEVANNTNVTANELENLNIFDAKS